MLAVSAPAAADSGLQSPTDPTALAHFEEGRRLYNAEDFDAAIAEWEKGFAVSPAPVFQFWMAEAHRLMDRCPRARELYTAFLATNPAPDEKELATDGRLACQTDPNNAASSSSDSAPRPERAPPVAAQPPPVAAPTVVTVDNVWYRDVAGDVLVGAGALSLGLGIGFHVAAASSRSSANDAVNLQDFNDHSDSLRTRRVIALASYIVGAGLLGAGVYRWATVADGSESTAVTGWVGGGEAGVGIARRF